MEESSSNIIDQTVTARYGLSLLEVENMSGNEGPFEEEAVVHQMTQQIMQGRLNESQTSMTQIGQFENTSTLFNETKSPLSPKFYRIDVLSDKSVD